MWLHLLPLLDVCKGKTGREGEMQRGESEGEGEREGGRVRGESERGGINVIIRFQIYSRLSTRRAAESRHDSLPGHRWVCLSRMVNFLLISFLFF